MHIYFKTSAVFLMATLTGCQVFSDRYEQAASPQMIELSFSGYSTGTKYIGVAVPDKPGRYHLEFLEGSIAYLKPNTDYALRSTGYVPGGKCFWEYIIHTPTKPQKLFISSRYKKGKCFPGVSTNLDEHGNDGFSIRRLHKNEKAKT